MIRDRLDKHLRELRRIAYTTDSGGAAPQWGATDTDPEWNWDSDTAVEIALANGATGELEPMPEKSRPFCARRRTDPPRRGNRLSPSPR